MFDGISQYGRNGWRPDDPDLSFGPLALLAEVELHRGKIASSPHL
jgi:hypothetical protein